MSIASWHLLVAFFYTLAALQVLRLFPVHPGRDRRTLFALLVAGGYLTLGLYLLLAIVLPEQ